MSAETPLSSVNGGGVAESGRGLNVVGGESDGEVAARVPHGQVTLFADARDGPTIAVLNPISGGETESAVVGPGDDHISDTGLIAIG